MGEIKNKHFIKSCFKDITGKMAFPNSSKNRLQICHSKTTEEQ